MKILRQAIWLAAILLLPSAVCFAGSPENLKTCDLNIATLNDSGLADVTGHGSPIALDKNSGKIILWDEAGLINPVNAGAGPYDDSGNGRSSIAASYINGNAYQQQGGRR